MQYPDKSNDHDHEHRFDPQDGDFCYARLNPMENVSEKGLKVRKVIRVPGSYVVEVDGWRYCQNKHDLTLRPPDGDESDSHTDTHDMPMATGVMPTLCPRPQLKVPKLPVQAMEQKDFNI